MAVLVVVVVALVSSPDTVANEAVADGWILKLFHRLVLAAERARGTKAPILLVVAKKNMRKYERDVRAHMGRKQTFWLAREGDETRASS